MAVELAVPIPVAPEPTVVPNPYSTDLLLGQMADPETDLNRCPHRQFDLAVRTAVLMMIGPMTALSRLRHRPYGLVVMLAVLVHYFAYPMPVHSVA